MKKEKTIIIKNPQLIKIRNNLRMIILQACRGEWNKTGNTNWEKYQKLMGALNRSIISCPGCGNIDRDMTFDSRTNQWVCFFCYDRSKFAF